MRKKLNLYSGHGVSVDLGDVTPNGINLSINPITEREEEFKDFLKEAKRHRKEFDERVKSTSPQQAADKLADAAATLLTISPSGGIPMVQKINDLRDALVLYRSVIRRYTKGP